MCMYVQTKRKSMIIENKKEYKSFSEVRDEYSYIACQEFFEPGDISKIQKFNFPQNIPKYEYVKNNRIISIICSDPNLINIYLNKSSIGITKLEDEWFYVKIQFDRIEIMSRVFYHKEVYKCDQIDGVIDCLTYLTDKYDL